uniref:Uncharacterized protein n=1 Tax=Arion vulgaris TaxID=1028688 RepID=A0A0B7AE28_9EUPU
MHSKRSSDMDDGMANMMYRFRSVGALKINPPPITDGNASSGSSEDKVTEKRTMQKAVFFFK